MTTITHLLELDEAGLQRLACLIALELGPGDTIALGGDLGAGKTTFARAAIRALVGDAEVEVPSPTFSLVQTYDTPRGAIAHCDLYRISDSDEVAELGLEEALARGALLVEWPERAPSLLPEDRLGVMLEEVEGGARRRVGLTGTGRWVQRIERLVAIWRFVATSGWGAAAIGAIPGDASARRYFRLRDGERCALLMDAPRMPDGPPIRHGLPYSRIAHLAEDVRPFVAVARHLDGLGLSAPRILANDLDAGLLLLEDLGDRVFGREIADGADQRKLWRAGVDVLLALHAQPVERRLPIGDGSFHDVPPFDLAAMQIEIELVLDWYVPAVTGAPAGAEQRGSFAAAWRPVLERILDLPPLLVLRDFHSPNLLWMPERSGARRAGVIDFQDALIGPAAYDLVSLLQDARLDVSEEIERELLDYYCAKAPRTQPGFDPARLRWAYAALGAQRNTKILGIFARLARRDGKPRYLAHIPRIWRYLARGLAHPELSSLAAWYDSHLPVQLRAKSIQA
jgi:tRNA threonylcarbamoyl adenosine modification protein YjeE